MRFTRLAAIALVGGCGVAVAVLFVVFSGGMVVLASAVGTVATVIALPVMWVTGQRRRARTLLAAWGTWVAFYVVVCTGLALLSPLFEHPRSVGQEVCADSGCFAVDKVDRANRGSEAAYTLFWHLTNSSAQEPRHFPGKGLELFLFDRRGRRFTLPDLANPLDVTLPPGGTVHQTITFTVPSDADELFLTAKYRRFTYQSLMPGELSLVPHRPAAMIRIQ